MIKEFKEKYLKKVPIVMLTAYDATMAQMINDVAIDGILVGDSLRHTFFGDSTTVTMTLQDMVYHTKAVKNGAPKSFIVSDMPFMTYNVSPEKTLENAATLVQAGAHAVKCEVRPTNIPTIARLVQEGIPVMAHIGLQPQYIHEIGGYHLKGTLKSEKNELCELAKSLANIGVFAIVLEKVSIELSKTITSLVDCPTIGIGAGPSCSGQILVTNDLLGLTPNFSPKFVKQYLNGQSLIKDALAAFKNDVETGQFPTNDHAYADETVQ